MPLGVIGDLGGVLTRTRRAALYLVTSVTASAVTMLVGLWATPRLLAWLGEERYGAFRVVLEWSGHLHTLELGLGGASLGTLALAFASQDKERFATSVATAIRALARVTVLMVAAAMVLVFLAPYLVSVPPPLAGDLRWGFVFVTATLLLTPLTPFRMVHEVAQRGYFVNLAILGQSLLVTALSLGAAWAGLGIAGQAAAFLAAQVPTYLAFIARARADAPVALSRAIHGQVDPDAAARMRSLNRPTLAVSLSGRVSVMSDAIIVGWLLGPAPVTTLFLTQRLMQVAQGQVQAIGNATFAALSELYASGAREQFGRRVVELTEVTAAIASAVLVPIAAFNGWFVDLWVGAEHFGGWRMTGAGALVAFLQSVSSLWAWCFLGTGTVGRVVRVQVIGAVINVAASIAFTLWLGPEGPLWGTAVSLVGWQLWTTARVMQSTFGVGASSLARAFVPPLFVGAAQVVAWTWFAEQRPVTGWIEWMSYAAGAGIGAALASTALMRRSSRQQVFARLRQLLPTVTR